MMLMLLLISIRSGILILILKCFFVTNGIVRSTRILTNYSTHVHIGTNASTHANSSTSRTTDDGATACTWMYCNFNTHANRMLVPLLVLMLTLGPVLILLQLILKLLLIHLMKFQCALHFPEPPCWDNFAPFVYNIYIYGSPPHNTQKCTFCPFIPYQLLGNDCENPKIQKRSQDSLDVKSSGFLEF